MTKTYAVISPPPGVAISPAEYLFFFVYETKSTSSVLAGA